MSSATIGLVVGAFSGNGPDWAIFAVVALGLPGSFVTGLFTILLQIVVLVIAAFTVGVDSGTVAGSGLSPLGYAFWSLVGLVHVAVLTAQTAVVRLLLRRGSSRRTSPGSGLCWGRGVLQLSKPR